AEHDGLSLPPVVVINLRAVGGCDCAHAFSLRELEEGSRSGGITNPNRQRPAASAGRLASKRNQARRSASSIQTSMRLAVATSRCSSHKSCASRILLTRSALS